MLNRLRCFWRGDHAWVLAYTWVDGAKNYHCRDCGKGIFIEHP